MLFCIWNRLFSATVSSSLYEVEVKYAMIYDVSKIEEVRKLPL